MKHLRWTALGLCVTALSACDSTPVDPDATGPRPDGSVVVAAPVFGAVPVLSEADGHLYDAVAAAGGINWADARVAAESLTSGACQGYLASITSADENAFILLNFPSVAPGIGSRGYWIGGFQDPDTTPADAGWMWVSGEAFGYTNWVASSPDDGGPLADEDAIHFVTVSDGGFGGVVGWDDLNQTETTPGYVVEFDGACTEDALIEIMLRLTQGEGPRNINMKSQGKIAAAVLSVAEGFDATRIDPETVTLGDGSDPDAPVAGNKHGRLMVSWPDLDGDGLSDALFHFNTQDLVAAGLIAGTTELTLRGMTTDGVAFSGTDAVAVK